MLPDALKFVNHPLVLNDLYKHIFYATVFLNFGWWVLTDRTKRNTKKGFVFALWQTSVCTIFTIMFMVTHDEWYSLGAHAAFLAGMLMDFVYGFIYFPEDMYPITTNVHHVAYFVLEYMIIYVYDFPGHFTLYFLQEFPSFMLNLKRYYSINNQVYERVFAWSFFLLRIVYFNFINCMYSDILLSGNYIFLSVVTLAVNYMHISWFYDYINTKPKAS